MEWGPLHKKKIQIMSDNIFKSTPLLDYLTKNELAGRA